MKFLGLVTVLLLSTGPVIAGEDDFAVCQFNQECLESESCADTEFHMSIRHDDDTAFIMETVAENIDGLVFDNGAPDVASTLLGYTDSAYHLLSIAPDGTARYTVHMSGPFVITYLGQCEVSQ